MNTGIADGIPLDGIAPPCLTNAAWSAGYV